jgi:PAS domain S-box-containing protein
MSAPEDSLTRPGAHTNGPDAGLREQLEFETLLTDLSAHFVNLPTDQIDGHIEFAQRRICETLGLDMSALWQWGEVVPDAFALTHLYDVSGGIQPVERGIDTIYPWCRQQMLLGRVVAISSLGDLPPEAAHDRASAQYIGIKSSLLLPLSVGGGPTIGILALNSMHVERPWPAALIKRLQLVAQVFTNALARKRAENERRESEQQMALAAESGEVGIWVWNIARNRVWGSDRWWRLFGLPPAYSISIDDVFERIHPDDRERVRQEVRGAAVAGGAYTTEFRLTLPGGEGRWLTARGRVRLSGDGHPATMLGATIDITARKHMESNLLEKLQEIEELKRQVERENIYLKEEIGLLVEHSEIVGKSAAIRTTVGQARQVAATDSTVLLIGETGTGKELLARAIHRMSRRKDRALVTINCASLPPTLIESELFGRERGAYTDALTRMAGRFEIADGSTLFLDEIGELPFEVQAKLLRVLEEGCFERLGSTKTLKADVRIIAATNRDLARASAEGRFRQDLYYRLNVFPIRIPPLRERPEDIPLLVWAFVREFEKRIGKRIDRIAARSIEAMQRYTWPGNVRELKNVIEHGMIVSAGGTLTVNLPAMNSAGPPVAADLDSVERSHILKVLHESGWRIGGKGGAAETLGLKRTTLQSTMKRLGIRRTPLRNADITSP